MIENLFIIRIIIINYGYYIFFIYLFNNIFKSCEIS
jgi:hypothetical protein